MDNTRAAIKEVAERLLRKHPEISRVAGVDENEYMRSLDDANERAKRGEGIDELIDFLVKCGMSEKQILKAMEIIERDGIKKYAHSLWKKAVAMYQSGVLIEEIKKWIKGLDMLEQDKAKIIAGLDDLNKKAKELGQMGNKIKGAVKKGKKVVIGFSLLILFLTMSVIYLLIRSFRQ